MIEINPALAAAPPDAPAAAVGGLRADRFRVAFDGSVAASG
jgi:hypothetical protein